MFHRLIAISTAIALVSASGGSLAQSFGGSGSGSRGMGGGMGGGSAFSGMGSSGFGGMGSSGFGGMGSSGFGGMGSSGFGGMGSSGFGGMGSSGFGGNSGFGNSGFGNNRSGSGQQNFIGRDANDIQSTFGQMNKAGAQFFSNMNKTMKSASNRRSTKKSTEQNSGQPARIEVKVAFNPPRQPADVVAKDIRTRLSKVLVANHMSQPNVTMEGDTAVVQGTAASENERDVISQLLAMEPSIHNVRNEMTIAPPAAAPSGTAPTPGS